MQSQMLPVLMHPFQFSVSIYIEIEMCMCYHLFILNKAAPMISAPSDSEEFTVHEQMNITITCSASGFPAPTLSFFRGTEMITNTGRIQLVEGKEVAGTVSLTQVSLSFTLSNAEDADSGEFSCVASTDIPAIGSLADTVNFNITVLGKNKYTYSPACKRK